MKSRSTSVVAASLQHELAAWSSHRVRVPEREEDGRRRGSRSGGERGRRRRRCSDRGEYGDISDDALQEWMESSSAATVEGYDCPSKTGSSPIVDPARSVWMICSRPSSPVAVGPNAARNDDIQPFCVVADHKQYFVARRAGARRPSLASASRSVTSRSRNNSVVRSAETASIDIQLVCHRKCSLYTSGSPASTYPALAYECPVRRPRTNHPARRLRRQMWCRRSGGAT